MTMPPTQPIHRCQRCGLYRPVRSLEGAWVCIDCNPGFGADGTGDTDTEAGE